MLYLLLALVAAAPDTLELSLDDALRVAMARSPARTEVSVSRTQSASTLARGIAGLLPTVTGSVGYARSDAGQGMLPESLRTGEDWSWTGTLTVNQVVFDPSVFAGLASGVIYSDYYATDARDKQARLVFDVTSDYLGLLKADLLRSAAAKAVARAEENLGLVSEKQKLGAASRIDVMRSQVQKSQADIELLTSDKALAVASERFKSTAGVEDAVFIRPTEQLTEPSGFEISDPDSLLAEIDRRNPGARLLEKSRSVASWNTAAAIGKALPSVSAYWTSSYSDSVFPSGIGQWDDHDAVTYGIQARFPLLDLKSYVLGIVDATNESRRARALARRTALQLRATATASVLGYTESRQRFDYASSNLELNRELYELATEQHRLGSISLLDLLSVETTLASAEASYIAALCDTYIQAAQVGYLLGEAEGRKETE
ncbi:MAG: TolC family protein [candidate division WOR-3 bacterium]|nr:MAG: TolC family protein [candidate division WOR-3 bacterium]